MLYNLYIAPWGVAIIIAIVILSLFILVPFFVNEVKRIFCEEPKAKDTEPQNCPN